MTASVFAIQEGFSSHDARKKRLGQYFSGLLVSKLLIALAARTGIRSVCDPMGGRGDMLVAARSILGLGIRVDGIEIDPVAHGHAKEILNSEGGESTFLLGNSFDASVVSQLQLGGYDLVVTNPPYVRYQAQKDSAGQVAKLPSAIEVRNGLRNCLSQIDTLGTRDRHGFLTLAEHYSGLSDLAVPAWILCAALVKPRGTLAMVVPESWLSRDYASVVRYLLLRWFRIEYVVEDVHAAWFTDAQVKTTLLVARRIPCRKSITDWQDETYLHVELPSTLADGRSLVGRAMPSGAGTPELMFSRRAQKVAGGTREDLARGCNWHRLPLAGQAAAVMHLAEGEHWLDALEQFKPSGPRALYVVPPGLATRFNGYGRFSTLMDLGVQVGQGLRTGANGFFYCDVVARNRTRTTVRSSLFEDKNFVIPSACALPVVRRQAEVRDAFVVRSERLPGVALAFQDWALPEHASAACARPLPSHAAHYVRKAATAKIGAKALPTLSAVAPNARPSNPRTGAAARFWYMLPDFAARHQPDLFMARVNSLTPKAQLNLGRKSLIDANFSTLWLEPDARISVHALLAYLNSVIAAVLMEHIGTVMGGGALKLEATHLRTLPIPKFSASTLSKLSRLGKSLSRITGQRTHEVRVAIDEIVAREIYGKRRAVIGLQQLRSSLNSKLVARQHRPSKTRSRV